MGGPVNAALLSLSSEPLALHGPDIRDMAEDTNSIISAALSAVLDQFLAARSSQANDELAAFDRTWSDLSRLIEHHLLHDELDVQTVRLAEEVSRTISALSAGFRRVELRSESLREGLQRDVAAVLQREQLPQDSDEDV